jgi:hypothetical protein
MDDTNDATEQVRRDILADPPSPLLTEPLNVLDVVKHRQPFPLA